MKTRSVLIFSFVILALNCFGQQRTTSESLDSLRTSFYVDADEMVSEFENYAREAEEEYLRYERQMKAEYERYVQHVKRVWGTDSVGSIVENTRSKWVEYGKDYQSRSMVDFDSGEIEVEVALTPHEANDPKKRNELLAEAVAQLLESRGSASPYSSKGDKKEPLTNHPVLEGLVDYSAYPGVEALMKSAKEADNLVASAKPINRRPAPPQPKVRGKEIPVAQTPTKPTTTKGSLASRHKAEADERAAAKERAREEAARLEAEREQQEQEWRKQTEQERNIKADSTASKGVIKEALSKAKELTKAAAKVIAENTQQTVRQVKGDDGKSRQVVTVKLTMVADKLSKNAALYKDLIAEFSSRFQVEQPLIYAIMEQESCFNPQATSWVPAYGLMQLVPTSGGRHAYRVVYGRDWCPTRDYLYNPRNNIELGTAYLQVLLKQFSAVKDYSCRRLCAIASYNTGAGNVSRAFTGKTSVSQATPLINQMNYSALYNHLTTRLTYTEARNYVSGVTRRMEKYIKK